MCVEDPWQSMQEAVLEGDGAAAWDYYQQLTGEHFTALEGDRGLQEALAELVYNATGFDNLNQFFDDLGLDLKGCLDLAWDAGILDLDVADGILQDDSITADEEWAVVENPELLGGLQTLYGAIAPHEIFCALSADAATFIQAVRDIPAFGDWVLPDNEAAVAVVNYMGEHALWVEVLQARNAWELALHLVGEVDHDWTAIYAGAPALFTWLTGALPKPVSDDQYLNALIVFGTGDGFTVEQKHVIFALYYGENKLGRVGDDFEHQAETAHAGPVHGHHIHVYVAVDPADQSLAWLLEQYTQMPRAVLAQCTKVIMAQYYQRLFRASGHADRWLSNAGLFVADQASADKINIPTSYTFQTARTIVMRSTNATGVADTWVPGDVGSGVGSAPLGVNRFGLGEPDASAAPDMNIFQNHATHEMGHVVGNRGFTPAPTSGKTPDDYTKEQYGWSENGGTAEGYARTLGFTAAMDTTEYDLADTAGNSVDDVNGSEIRDLLTDKAKGGNSPPAALVGAGKFPNQQAALDAIGNHNTLKNNLLYKTVVQNNGGNAHTFHFGLSGSPAEVHYYAVKYNNQWAKYKTAGWNEKPSHYAVTHHKEFWAEAFCAYFTGGSAPAKLSNLLSAIQTSEDSDFADAGAGGGGAGASNPEATAEGSSEAAAAGLSDPSTEGEGEDMGDGLTEPLPALVHGTPLS
ncbi:MAG: hypothetical protein JRI25_04970 [Deltaproteobacteria bacterium]|nr:hypothetical protein [Deltaproteobacteria bacterium]